MSDIPAPCAGVVLAAGSGSRFGEPKAPLEVDGERLVDRSVRVLREGGCDPIFVILGAWEGSVDDALVIVNHGWEEGMGSSLRLALQTVTDSSEADYALITLVDLPGLTSESVQRVAAADSGIAVATFDGERGHPVRIPREHFRELIDTVGGDEGARSFVSQRDDVILVELVTSPPEKTSTCQVTLLAPSRWRLSL
ncbi:MAG: nucleotidyltransferase family protein [Actinobacteria bacterium]|nr:nucleotidyltransferase family protein [Actinomycetota bacterium]